MAFTNNVMIVRHKLLAKLVNLWKENKLTNEIDRLPIELSLAVHARSDAAVSTKSVLYTNINFSRCWVSI